MLNPLGAGTVAAYIRCCGGRKGPSVASDLRKRGGRPSIKHAILDGDDLAGVLVDQQRIIAIPDPGRAVRRRRQGVIHIVGQPVIARPEKGRQGFAEGPATRIPARRLAIGRRAEAALCVEGLVELPKAPKSAARATVAGAIDAWCGTSATGAAMEIAAAVGAVKSRIG